MTTDQVSNIQSQNSTATESQNASRPILRSEDSFTYEGVDLWNLVSDESFLETERQCQSPMDNDKSIKETNTTMIFDIEEPTFLNDSSVFESPKVMLSPIKQVAMRRPSTIIEESTIRSINSSDECSRVGSSLSLKQSIQEIAEKSSKMRSYRPSMVNVFPSKRRVGFYDTMDVMTSSCKSSAETEAKRNSVGKENSLCLISLSNSHDVADTTPTEHTYKSNVHVRKDSVCLVSFDDDESPRNMSVDQTQNDSSFMDNEQKDEFNDTLEAVDNFMMQGKKILDKTANSTSILQPHVTFSPRSQSNSLLIKTLARRHLMSVNSDILEKKLF